MPISLTALEQARDISTENLEEQLERRATEEHLKVLAT
jgi:hypothetical protein